MGFLLLLMVKLLIPQMISRWEDNPSMIHIFLSIDIIPTHPASNLTGV